MSSWDTLETGRQFTGSLAGLARSRAAAARLTPEAPFLAARGAARGPGGVHLMPGGGLPPVAAGVFPTIMGGAGKLLAPIAATAIGAGAAWLGAQALGLGEGGGIGGLNLLGGDVGVIPGTMIPLGGPGLPEPPAHMVAKEWSTGTAQFYMLIDGRIAVYSKKAKRWKVYRPKKHIVLSSNPRIGTLLRGVSRTMRLFNSITKKARKSGAYRTTRRTTTKALRMPGIVQVQQE